MQWNRREKSLDKTLQFQESFFDGSPPLLFLEADRFAEYSETVIYIT